MATQTKTRQVGPLEQRFNSIMNARYTATLADEGKLVSCQVQSAKLEFPDEKTGFIKDIYSFDINKLNVIRSEWFTNMHAEAKAAEAAGEPELAEELFNKLMNAAQLNTNVIVNVDANGNYLNRKTYQRKEPVKVYLGVTDTVDKETGEVRKSIIVKSIVALESTTLSKSNLFGADIEEEEESAGPLKEVGKVAKA